MKIGPVRVRMHHRLVVVPMRVRGTHKFGVLMQVMAVENRGIAIVPVSEEQTHVARQAYTDFGKGRHPAGLNFGDCFAYALAKVTGEPLLFKGKDFSKTDIASALERRKYPVIERSHGHLF